MGGLTWPTGKILSDAMSPLLGATLRFTISNPLFFLLARKYNDSLLLPKEYHRRIAFAGIFFAFYVTSSKPVLSAVHPTLVVAWVFVWLVAFSYNFNF